MCLYQKLSSLTFKFKKKKISEVRNVKTTQQGGPRGAGSRDRGGEEGRAPNRAPTPALSHTRKCWVGGRGAKLTPKPGWWCIR